MSTATSVMKGTCFTGSECVANGGTASGNCASGNLFNDFKSLAIVQPHLLKVL